MNSVSVAKIALSASVYAIDRPYSYLIPAALEGLLEPGMRVIVAFGSGNRRCDGIVLSVDSEIPDREMKEVLAVLDDEPVLDGDGIRLALWMREMCFCTVYQAARAMLPAGLWFSLRDVWRVADGVGREAAFEAAGRSPGCRKLLELLYGNGGSMESGQIREEFEGKSPTAHLKQLQEGGILVLETSASRGVGDKTEKVISLAVSVEEALNATAGKRAPIQRSVVELLAAVGQAGSKEVCYHTGATSATLKALEKKGLIEQEIRQVFRRPAAPRQEKTGAPVLNSEQQAAVDGMTALLDRGEPAAALLYGVTGSGKTLVYMALIDHVLSMGRSALVLVPEIALTPQLMQKFSARFGERVAVMHSSLRIGERYDEWRRAKTGQAKVVLGTRSAVFAPLEDLGLVILDEEQEHTFKSENTPRYHARDVAKYRCMQTGSLLVLGSATPSVESMYQAREGNYHLFTMRKRFNEQAMPRVVIADMKKELQSGNGTDISGPLRQELESNLSKGEQSILLLNRRGASRMVTCGECGWVPGCPRCSVALTYHSANRRLMCHHCGFSIPLPAECPECGGKLAFVGTGTQKVERELEEMFPGTEVLRMDTDTVSPTNPHEKQLDRFAEEKIPFMVGTQMVAKGLDFENVTLVGVIAADLSLYADNFRAGEMTFSLITQAVGRAGRGDKSGRAVIQTMTPENEVILTAARQDYDSFFSQELEMRRLCGCSPFRDEFRISASGPDENTVIQACARMRQALDEALAEEGYRDLDVEVLGPAPASVTKVNNQYRYRVTAMGKNGKKLRALLAHLLRRAQQDKANKGVSIQADMNPFD